MLKVSNVYILYIIWCRFFSLPLCFYRAFARIFEMISFVRIWEVSQCPSRGFIHKAWGNFKFYKMARTLAKWICQYFFLVRSLFFNLLHNMLFFEIVVLSKKPRYLVIMWVQTIYKVSIPLFWHLLVFKSIMLVIGKFNMSSARPANTL